MNSLFQVALHPPDSFHGGNSCLTLAFPGTILVNVWFRSGTKAGSLNFLFQIALHLPSSIILELRFVGAHNLWRCEFESVCVKERKCV